MSATAERLAERLPLLESFRRAAHPEWWLGVTSLAGWVAMLPHWLPPGWTSTSQSHQGAHALMTSASDELVAWLLMVCAMMTPSLVEPIRQLAYRTARRRWSRARAAFLIGYLGVWLLPGVLYVGLRAALGLDLRPWAGLLFAVAALWARSRARSRWLDVCRSSRPIAPEGSRADLDAAAAGARIGGACVASCGFAMAACAATGHTLLAMIGGLFLVLIERNAFRPPRRRIAIGFLLLAVVFSIDAWASCR